MFLNYFLLGNSVFEEDLQGVSHQAFYQLYLDSQQEKFSGETALLKIQREGKKCSLVETDILFKDVSDGLKHFKFL